MRDPVLARRATARFRHWPINLVWVKWGHTFLMSSGKVKLSYGKEGSSTRCQWNTFNLLYAMTSCRLKCTLWTHHSLSRFSLKLAMLGKLSGRSTQPYRLDLPQLSIKCLWGLSIKPSHQRGMAWREGPAHFYFSQNTSKDGMIEVVFPLFEINSGHIKRRAAATVVPWNLPKAWRATLPLAICVVWLMLITTVRPPGNLVVS